MYLGKKLFTSIRYKQIKKKKKKIKVESNWQEYYGSNAELQTDVLTNGEEYYKREILKLCLSKSELSYFESKLIFENDALIKNEFYNSWISCRINKKNLKGIMNGI